MGALAVASCGRWAAGEVAMGKRQKVAAIGRPSDGVDDGEDCSSSDLDLSSDELSDSDDPPRAAATGKAKATAQRKAKAPGKAKATGNRKRTATRKGKGSGSGKRTTKAAQSAAMQQRLEAAQQRLEATQQVQGAVDSATSWSQVDRLEATRRVGEILPGDLRADAGKRGDDPPGICCSERPAGGN